MNHDLFTEYQPYIFLIIGMIVLIVSVFGKSTKSELMQTGIVVDGIVFEQDNDINFSLSFENSSTAKNKTTIRFVTEKGEWITGLIEQEFQTYYTGQYKAGDTVKVYYDKDNPYRFYVDTNQSEKTGRLILIVIGLIFISIGLYKLFV